MQADDDVAMEGEALAENKVDNGGRKEPPGKGGPKEHGLAQMKSRAAGGKGKDGGKGGKPAGDKPAGGKPEKPGGGKGGKGTAAAQLA